MKLGRFIVILTPFLTDKSGVSVVALETNTMGGSANVRDKKERFGVKTMWFGADRGFTHRVGAGRRERKLIAAGNQQLFFF